MSKKLNAQITISASNKASPAFRDIANDSEILGKKLEDLGSRFSSLGSAFDPAMLGGVLGGVSFAEAINSGMNFEHQMQAVKALSGATGTDFDALTKKAKEMGVKSVFSATEAGQAFQYMAQAGWNTKEMLGGLEGIMNLAAASGEDLALTSDIVTDALTAFGLQAKDAEHFADVLAQTSARSNTDVAKMGYTFKYVAPLAGALGFSIEDVAVSIGLMANAGIKAETAGTSMRGMLSRLIDPTKKVDDAMQALGINIRNADGSYKELSEIIDQMRVGYKALGQEQGDQAIVAMAGQEALSGWLAVIRASEGDLQSLTKEINEVFGTTEKMANIRLDTLRGDIKLFGSAFEGLGITIYEQIESPLRQSVQTSTESLQYLTNNFEKVANSALLFGSALVSISTMKKLAGGQSIALALEDAKLHGVTTTLIDRTLGLDAAMLKRMVTEKALQSESVKSAQASVARAEAELSVAQATVASAEAQLASARSAGSTAVTQRQVMQAAVLEQKALVALDSAQVGVATKSNVLSVAQGKLSATMTATSASISKTNLVAKSLGKSLLAAFGGPAGVAITGITTGLMYLAMRETEAEKAARSLQEAQEAQAGAMKIITGEQSRYNEKLAETARLMQEIAVEKATEALRQSMNAIKAEIKNFTEESRSGVFGANIAATLAHNDLSRLKEIMKAVEAGKASAEDFSEELAKVIRNLEATGREGSGLHTTLKSLFENNFVATLTDAQSVLDKAQNKNATVTLPVDVVPSHDAIRTVQEEAKKNEIVLPAVLIPDHSDARGGLDDAMRIVDAEMEKARENLQLRTDFENEYQATVFGGHEAQLASIQSQADAYAAAGADRVRIEEWVAQKTIETSRDASAGAIRAMQDYADAATNIGEQVESVVGGTFTGLEDVLLTSTENMADAWSDMATSMIDDISRLVVRSQITGPLAEALGGAIGSMFTSDSSGGAVSNVVAQVFHDGGVVGAGGRQSSVPTSVFAGAPRFHDGAFLAPDEVPAILQTGERVLNRREAAAYSGGVTVPINVTIVDQTQSGVQMESQKTRNGQGGYDIELFIKNVVSRDISQGNGGTISKSLETKYGLRRQSYGM